MPISDTFGKAITKITQALARKNVPEPPMIDDSTETSGDYEREWREVMGVDPSRTSAYQDYMIMEAELPVIPAALDATADTAVCGADGDSEAVYQLSFDAEEGKKPNPKHQAIVDDLEARVGLKEDCWEVIRGFLHLGDEFTEVVIDPGQMQVSKLKPLPAESIVKIPDLLGEEYKNEVAYQQYDQEGKKIAEFKAWQVVHYGMRIRRTALYGRSMLYAARRTFRQLQMIEDSMVINRLKRATMRYVHKVPTGKLSPKEAMRFVQAYKRQFTRYRRFDPKTGKLILGALPMTEETDFYVPVGENLSGDVTAIQGQTGMDRIADVEYFLNMLVSALGTPKSYIGFEQDTHAKSVITTLDVRFGRLVRRTQLTHGVGQRQIYDTEFALKGIDPKTVGYRLIYPSLGTEDHVRMWQVELLKAQVSKLLKVDAKLIADDEYLLRKVMEIDDEDDIAAILKANEEAEKKAAEQQKQIAGLKAPSPGQMPGTPPELNPEPKALVPESVRSGPLRHRVHAAVDFLLTRNGNLRRELNEVYGLSQPLEVKRSLIPVSVETVTLHE